MEKMVDKIKSDFETKEHEHDTDIEYTCSIHN